MVPTVSLAHRRTIDYAHSAFVFELIRMSCKYVMRMYVMRCNADMRAWLGTRSSLHSSRGCWCVAPRPAA